jgi:predicted enzyme related to lactoylglutathione lyase
MPGETAVPRLKFTALQVRDVDLSLRFYREVIGLPLEPVELDSGDPWLAGRRYHAAWGDDGELVFALLSAVPGEESRRTRIGFGVEDLETAHRRAVESGADVIHPPRVQPFGSAARYRDPDGNIVSLAQLG